MKLVLLLLIISSCYYFSSAQIASDNGTSIVLNNSSQNVSSGSTGGNSNNTSSGFTEIEPSSVDNNPFIQGLINFGSQYVVGHALDSGIFYYHNGNYTKVYSVKQQEGDTLYLTADVQITINYGSFLHAIFTVHYDGDNDYREVTKFSYEYQNYSLDNPSGGNITYDVEQDAYDVLTFEGYEQSVNYQNEDLSNQTTSYSGQDFLHNYSNFTSLNVSQIYDNDTLQFSFNAALRGLRTSSYSSGLLPPDYGQLNVSQLYSIDTYNRNETGDYYRFDFDFNTANQSGRAVVVVLCPTYNYYYPPYPYPIPYASPLNVASDGVISSTASSEAASTNAAGTATLAVDPPVNTMGPNAQAVDTVQSEPIRPTASDVSLPATNANVNASSEANAPVAPNDNSTDSSSNSTAQEPAKPIATDGAAPNSAGISIVPPYPYPNYYNYNCLYSNLDYYWFEHFAGSSA